MGVSDSTKEEVQQLRFNCKRRIIKYEQYLDTAGLNHGNQSRQHGHLMRLSFVLNLSFPCFSSVITLAPSLLTVTSMSSLLLRHRIRALLTNSLCQIIGPVTGEGSIEARIKQLLYLLLFASNHVVFLLLVNTSCIIVWQCLWWICAEGCAEIVSVARDIYTYFLMYIVMHISQSLYSYI